MIDLQTLLLAAVATDLCIAATVALGPRRIQREGNGLWIGALLARAAALALYALPGSGGDQAAVVLATGLFALALTLQGAALLEFGGRRLPAWVHLAVFIAVALPFALLGADFASRLLFAGLAFAAIFAVHAGVAMQLRAPMSGATRAILASSFALAALIFAVRAVAGMTSPAPLMGFLAPGAWESASFLGAFAAALLSSCGYLLMLRERADAAAARLASLDPLTGAYNRRTFHETAERELARARRASQPLSIIMLDLDHFKGINERHGHRIGDEVIRTFAEIIRLQLRKEDLLVRFGGEAFCVMLPSVPGPGAVVVAGRIRKAVAADPLRIEGHEIAITVSAGVAARLDEGPESIDELLGRADQALDLAKKRGRNRVVALSLGRSIAA